MIFGLLPSSAASEAVAYILAAGFAAQDISILGGAGSAGVQDDLLRLGFSPSQIHQVGERLTRDTAIVCVAASGSAERQRVAELFEGSGATEVASTGEDQRPPRPFLARESAAAFAPLRDRSSSV